MPTWVTALDAAVQHRFDAFVHALMRATGTTKRTIRRNLWCLYGVDQLLIAWVVWTDTLIGLAIGTALTLAIMAWVISREDEEDAKAERSAGALSRADRGASWHKAWGTFWLIWRVVVGVGLPLDLLYWLQFGSPVFLLCLGYLCRTPPAAPKKERRHGLPPLAAPVHS